MTHTRKLAKSEWQDYFDRVARGLGTRQVQIEVAALNLGDQVAAEWVGMTNLSYDPKDDVLQVGTDHLDHNIPHPAEVWVAEGTDGLEAIEVKRENGVTEIIRLAKPLLLPAPAAG